jgi:hypothetical protein
MEHSFQNTQANDMLYILEYMARASSAILSADPSSGYKSFRCREEPAFFEKNLARVVIGAQKGPTPQNEIGI